MMVELVSKGVIIGFSVAAPVGPIGVLCFQRSLSRGWLQGVVAGLGAACADAFYGGIAALGLVSVIEWLTPLESALKLFGAVFLCYLGIKTLCRSTVESSSRVSESALSRSGSVGGFFMTFGLTLTNPMTILAFLAIFASLGMKGQASTQPWWLVAGVFLGSAAWWLVLSTLAMGVKYHLSSQYLTHINRLSGIILIGFALWVLF
ncbi:LysE family translocator [Motiliproteus sp. MSK22-1]|uniref:LysE family translocator n=1 Tax=Motiliproteus sp. MSK22-1 TaxID=1897630 RepID=UPI00097837EC|nr:LysE family translocator [Motiliproteus sp. MSK22-1]OMH28114.1 hypothetical protein BGP75_22380 [Motiliproteus sp. MSK22-1]